MTNVFTRGCLSFWSSRPDLDFASFVPSIFNITINYGKDHSARNKSGNHTADRKKRAKINAEGEKKKPKIAPKAKKRYFSLPTLILARFFAFGVYFGAFFAFGAQEDIAVSKNDGVQEDIAVSNNNGVQEDIAVSTNDGVQKDTAISTNDGVQKDTAISTNDGVREDIAVSNNNGGQEDIAVSENDAHDKVSEMNVLQEDATIPEIGDVQEDDSVSENGAPDKMFEIGDVQEENDAHDVSEVNALQDVSDGVQEDTAAAESDIAILANERISEKSSFKDTKTVRFGNEDIYIDPRRPSGKFWDEPLEVRMPEKPVRFEPYVLILNPNWVSDMMQHLWPVS